MKKHHRIILIVLLGIFLSLPNVQRVQARDTDGDIVVIVDPGHGGLDGGATSVNGVSESVLNWNIALALKAELETYSGVKVYLTRGSAEWNSNTGRGREGSILGADLFVSIHNNASSNASVSGVDVYGTVDPDYKSSMQSLCTQIAANVSALGIANGGYKTRSYSAAEPDRDYYTMLEEAAKVNIPGIIIEHCYLSNSGDAAFIENSVNQGKCGAADALAIANYFGLSKRGVNGGSSITLTRTYSAYMVTNEAGITYTSSNTSVASVQENGLITAVGEGSATITTTLSDGSSETVQVTVPGISMVAIAAGVNPTFYDENMQAYDQSKVMVKAIYNDGSVIQLSSGYTIGSLTAVDTNVYDIPISYNGYSNTLRIYGTGSAGSYGLTNNQLVGSNTDILRIPGMYEGITDGSGNIDTNNEVSTEVVTTEEATTEETTTEEATTEEETTEEMTTEETITEEATTEEATTEGATKESINNNQLQMIVLVGLGIGIIGTGIVFLRRKNDR